MGNLCALLRGRLSECLCVLVVGLPDAGHYSLWSTRAIFYFSGGHFIRTRVDSRGPEQ